MRLSEAIRLGAMQGPQVFGRWLDGKGGSCALGAIYLAIGQNETRSLERCFPRLSEHVSEYFCLKAKIAQLNDYGRWSREEIAKWIVANGYDCEYVPKTTATKVTRPTQEAVCV